LTFDSYNFLTADVDIKILSSSQVLVAMSHWFATYYPSKVHSAPALLALFFHHIAQVYKYQICWHRKNPTEIQGAMVN